MQRIDETTYIDDTLVTCAEYQLFIDEMREQGKYYQPDHWSSYQFPEGQSREPILGVRPSDAILFCEWLAQRENKGWKFRLLSQEEALNYQMKFSIQAPFGYWVMGSHKQTKFTWIGPVPDNPRKVANQYALEFARDLFPFLASELSRHLQLDLDFSELFARDFANLKAQNVDSDQDNDTASSLSNFAYFQRHKFDHGRMLVPELDRALDNAHAIVFDRVNVSARTDTLKRALVSALDLARAFKLSITSDIGLNLDIRTDADFNNQDITSDNHLYLYSIIALQIYIDIYTLQERIAGRSPAFEGIRLVKEWIR